jgi:hypothetical protein
VSIIISEKEAPLTQRADKVSLKTYLDMTYFSLAMSFVEESAKTFGMEIKDALKLRLACEEIFTYLLGSNQKGKAFTLEATDGIFYVGLKFLLEVRSIDSLDFTPDPLNDGEGSLREMGLIIASRSVDKLRLIFDGPEGFGVELLKDKTYPEMSDFDVLPAKPLKTFSIKPRDSEVLKLFARQVTSHYGSQLYPAAFLYPGKIADMVASGHYHALVASDSHASAAGGVLWHPVGARMIEFAGPYLFNQPPEYGMAEALVDHLLMAVAKSQALCLLTSYATPELPKHYFDLLGAIEYTRSDDTKQTWPFFYRSLNEDPGTEVWAHPVLQSFLKEEYGRLAFARKIVLTTREGEGRPPNALLSPRFDRTQHLVILKAMWDGKDVATVLEKHVAALEREGFSAILFELDCAHAWQANLAPVLMEQGFAPRLVIPYGGTGDIVFFQYTRKDTEAHV